MTQNGRAATGVRPLLVVLVEYSNFPPFSATHPSGYYDRLAFGGPSPPFSTDAPMNPASLAAYFRENSHSRFTFSRVAVVGPLQMGMLNDPGPEARTAGILSQVGAAAPQLFVGIDDNDNRVIEFDELCVLLFENIPQAQPANRDNNPVVIQVPFGGAMVNVSIRVHFAGAGPLTPFYQIAHELAHSLGTVDLYNVGEGNQALTLMSRYPFFSNDQVSVHLDAWHKLRLGWIEPRCFPIATPGSAVVDEGPAGALLLWDESRRGTEFFLVERRRPDAAGVLYDTGVAGDGVCLWRAQQAMGFAAHLGAPGLAVGGSGIWTADSQTPLLTWSDGTSTGRTLKVTPAADGAMLVAWGGESDHPSTRHQRLFHGGNGVSPVDSGLPLQGVFFGITSEGNLEWNRYNGRGEQVGDPQSPQNWASNTGNLIGRGFGQMRHVFACGDGVIMAVHPNGNLHWYGYDGHGESDITGFRGWRPNSGNVIGNGWQNFLKIFVMPRAGSLASQMKIFAVAPDGDLYWYSYSGGGEQDPSGTFGWHPNSGNRVGNGWQNFLHLHGSSNVVFGVHEDGRLLWYSYVGHGEDDPSGASGWLANSGNAIGRGWAGMRHVCGGVTDLGGFGHVVFGVTESGDLRWYRYTGHGEPDETGAFGWDARSGAKIGTGW